MLCFSRWVSLNCWAQHVVSLCLSFVFHQAGLQLLLISSEIALVALIAVCLSGTLAVATPLGVPPPGAPGAVCYNVLLLSSIGTHKFQPLAEAFSSGIVVLYVYFSWDSLYFSRCFQRFVVVSFEFWFQLSATHKALKKGTPFVLGDLPMRL